MTPTRVQATQHPIYGARPQLARMVGRERESAIVEELLLGRNHVLGATNGTGPVPVTLTGMAGIGKTRLAMHVAYKLVDSFADGVCFVDMPSITDVGTEIRHARPEHNLTLVASSIAQALGIIEQPGKALTDLLKEYLAGKHLLLMLDGFEHVLEAATLIESLLSAAPQVEMLITSRVPLGLNNEREHRLTPLAIPKARPQLAGNGRLTGLVQNESVQLFVQQAQTVEPDFTLDEKNAGAVISICRHLRGLPLAIELAAARAGASSPQEVLSSLRVRSVSNHALTLTPTTSTANRGDSQALTQTLRRIIDWCYNHLADDEKRLLQRLSVFSGGFALEAAELVCEVGVGSQESAFNITEPTPDSQLPTPIHADLPTALEAIAQAGLVRLGSGTGNRFISSRLPIPSSRLPIAEPRFMLPRAIRDYAMEQLQAHGEEVATRRRHAAYYATLTEEAELHLRGPHTLDWLSRLDEELPNLRAALRWAENDPARGEMAVRLSTALGLVWGISQRLSEERMHLSAMMDRARAENETSNRAAAQANALWAASMRAVAFLAWQRGDYEAAHTLDEKNLRTYREMGDNRQVALAFLHLGNAASKQGEYTKAQLHIEESLIFFKEVGDKSGAAESLESLAIISQEKSDLEAARTFYQECLALRREVGYQGGIAASLLNLGEVERALGNYALAGALYEQSLAIYRLTHKGGMAASLHNLGQVALHIGEIARARELFEESLALFRQLGFAQGVASSIAGLAGIESRYGEALRAGKLLAASFSIIESTGGVWSFIDRTEYNRSLSLACAQADGAAWQAAWDKGQAMSIDEAIAYALQKSVISSDF